MSRGRKKLTSAERLWALRTLWAVRRGEMSHDHFDAQKAVALLGAGAASEVLDDRAPKGGGGGYDMMRSGRRLSGSFETNRRRH
jgi:hypothetical protein